MPHGLRYVPDQAGGAVRSSHHPEAESILNFQRGKKLGRDATL